MPIDYSEADKVLSLSFGRLQRAGAALQMPEPGSLSRLVGRLLRNSPNGDPVLQHQDSAMFASAGVDMWHRSIHSFLWSVALTSVSPIWSSICGYYSSHFVMRAFAHSMGIFKSFQERDIVQVVTQGRDLVCARIDPGSAWRGEHPFYWKVAKGHPEYVSNALFTTNSERDATSESSHRTYANYVDHIAAYPAMAVPDVERVHTNIEKISRIRRHSVEPPNRDGYPDLSGVQILAFQRIVEFQDFLDRRVGENRFWRAHRRPTWCRDFMVFQIEEQDSDLEIDA